MVPCEVRYPVGLRDCARIRAEIVSRGSVENAVRQRVKPEIRLRIWLFFLCSWLPLIPYMVTISFGGEYLLKEGAFLWFILFTTSLISIGLLIYQVLLAHERHHHELFKYTNYTKNVKLKLLLVAPVMGFTPLSYFLPGLDNLILNNMFYELYIAVSNFVIITLIGPYIARLAWEYFSLDQLQTTLIFSGILLIAMIFLILALFSPGDESTLLASPRILAIYSAMTFIAILSLTISVRRSIPDYQSKDTYLDEEPIRWQCLDGLFIQGCSSYVITSIAGLFFGIAFPLLVGLNFIYSINTITLSSLVFWGYFIMLVVMVVFGGWLEARYVLTKLKQVVYNPI